MQTRAMSPVTPSWRADLCVLFFIAAGFMLLFLGSHALITPDEARYTEVAREMLASGDYITPTVNGVAFLDKPPLFYWLQASSLKLFGISEWSIRLWPALFGVFGGLFTYIAGRMLYCRRTAWLSAMVLLTSPLYFGAAHYVNMDLEVAIWVSAALFSFLIALTTTNRQAMWWMMGCGFVGLAVLTKGLLGIAFPGLILGIWLYLRRQKIPISLLAWGAGLITLMVLPWMILAQRANPDFFHYFFVVQQFSRFVEKSFNNVMPIWFYGPVVLVGFLPWTLFLVQAIKQQIRTLQDHTKKGIALFLLIWPFVIFIFFSIPSSKIVGYILPVIPPLALMVGHYLASRWQTAKRWIVLSLAMGMVLILLILNIASGFFIKSSIKPFISTVQSMQTAQTKVVSYQRFYQELPLYLQQTIVLVANWDDPILMQSDDWRRELLLGIKAKPESRQWMWNEETFWQQWQSKTPLLVFLQKKHLSQFKQHAKTPVHVLQDDDHIILVSNHLA
jgi:4-amino-4-deoxy-L-arabinose transferase-like glycosyltransferase